MLRVCTSSTDTSLLSLTSYKVAIGTTATSDDGIMQSALDRATALIEGYVGYPLRRQVYEETVAGYGGNELLLSRTPVRSIESILYGEETIASTSYSVESEHGGLVRRDDGWPWTAGVEYDMVAHVLPLSERRSYTAVYEAGYCTAGSTESGWLTTGEAVPGDIEAAIMHTATFLYQNAGRDFSVSSKKIGDLSITYQGGGQSFGQGGTPSIGIPDVAKGLVSHLRRF